MDEAQDVDGKGYPHAVVLKGLEGKGHHVYTDNYYSSPALFRNLRDLGFGACGTVHVNRRGLPAAMKATLAKGETTSALIDETMMALKWMDKRPVCMLTTIHDNQGSSYSPSRGRPGGNQEACCCGRIQQLHGRG